MLAPVRRWICRDGAEAEAEAEAGGAPPPYAPLPLPLATVSLRVNGTARALPARLCGAMTLGDYLREHEQLTGTKLSCREGGCGACTVLLRLPGESAAMPANACLRLLVACDGCDVTTVEGIGDSARPHAFQSALAEHDGSQCGFCSPGMVAALVSLLDAPGGPPTDLAGGRSFPSSPPTGEGLRRSRLPC
ncbi:hypothetical protein KFE25_010403 [Diacronema lutheri]|uniref:2Fe-2S ferredoxin-type domain-containing protein n=1 Tax=Diacronema lutheri TaxID=2081491 RepID=A0A8J6CCK5_DIALT|nr:hypothetical protein KFE25_010403 [Diacronema lutheri]